MMTKPVDQMTIEELLEEAGNPPCTINTYLYVSTAGRIVAMEKADRESYPRDHMHALGYARRFMGSAGSGMPFHV